MAEVLDFPQINPECLWCGELVLPGEYGQIIQYVEGRQVERVEGRRVHRECLLRMTLGSATHVRGECARQGGALECHACEEGMTLREAARASQAAFDEKLERDRKARPGERLRGMGPVNTCRDLDTRRN